MASQFPSFHPAHSWGTECLPKAFQYASFAAASVQVTYWFALIVVKRTISELLTLCSNHPLQARQQTIRTETTEYAANLCQSVVWLTQPKHRSCGIMRLAGPLYKAGRWFAVMGDQRRAKWCWQVKRSIERGDLISPYEDDIVDEEAMMSFADDHARPEWMA